MSDNHWMILLFCASHRREDRLFVADTRYVTMKTCQHFSSPGELAAIHKAKDSFITLDQDDKSAKIPEIGIYPNSYVRSVRRSVFA